MLELSLVSELIDVRCKITPEANHVLEALARAGVVDKSEVIRTVLHEWALREITKATLVVRLTRDEGRAKAATGG